MKDHNYVSEDGTLIPVAKMSTQKIQELLVEGIKIDNCDGEKTTVEGVIERMRIELLIRELGL